MCRDVDFSTIGRKIITIIIKYKYMEYIGTRKKRLAGRIGFMVSFSHKSNRYAWGFYKTEKEAAKAYDLFVIRKGFKRKTNFFKKKFV